MATIVQAKANPFGVNFVTFDSNTVSGKTLFLWEAKRDEAADAGDAGSSTLWLPLSADVSSNGLAGGDHGRWWYYEADGTDTFEVGSCRAYAYETDIDYATFDPGDVTLYEVDDAGTSATLALGTVTDPTSSQIILYGAVYDTAFAGSLPATAGTGWDIDYNANANASPPTGASDQHPHTLVMRWDGSAPLTGSATIGGAHPYAGVMIQTEAGALATCDAPMLFDVYSLGDADAPVLTYRATLCDAFHKSIRIELDGTGSGKFSINRQSADATEAILGNGDGDVRYVQVRIPGITGWDEPRFGFFIETGDFRLLDSDEDGGETLTFSGHGSLAYLDFARMAAHSYLTTPFIGEDPFGGLWRLYVAGTGSKPGQILARVIAETQEAGRPSAPLPLLTYVFDYTDDSDSNTWSSSDATDEFSAQIGESVLSVAGRLIGTGALTLQMSPDFVLGAYNTFGTDRTSTSFASNKVRLVGGTNIAEGLTRQVRPSQVATHMEVYGEEEASVVASLADAADRVTREGYVSAFGKDATALEAVGDAELAELQLRSESLNVRIATGDDDATGLYLPWDDFWVGDTVTLHTGTGEFDYENVGFRVAAINIIEPLAAKEVTDLEVNVELGSTRIGDPSTGGGSTNITSSTGGGSSGVPPHTHPTATVGAELNRHGGQSVISAHGNMGATETFDPAAGNVHTGTLNANCTFTLSAPVGTGAATLELWITGSGTRTWTWPGSVTWDGGVTGSPPADTETVRVILETIDGGTNWIANMVGGLTVETLDDLTDVTITSPATAQRLRYNGSAWVNSALKWSPTTTFDGTSWLMVVDGSGNPVLTEV